MANPALNAWLYIKGNSLTNSWTGSIGFTNSWVTINSRNWWVLEFNWSSYLYTSSTVWVWTLTVAMWMYCTSTDDYPAIFWNHNTNFMQTDWTLYRTSASYWYAVSSGSSSSMRISSTRWGKWIMYVYTKNWTEYKWYLYDNWQLKTANTTQYNLTTAFNIAIWADNYSGSWSQKFKWYMWDVAISTSVWSATDVQNYLNSTIAKYEPQKYVSWLYYKWDKYSFGKYKEPLPPSRTVLDYNFTTWSWSDLIWYHTSYWFETTTSWLRTYQIWSNDRWWHAQKQITENLEWK